MQLKRGARETLLHLYSDLDYLIAEAHDPIAVELLARRIKERIRDEIEPRLQRAVPSVEDRLDMLEQQVTELAARTDPKLIVLPERQRKAEEA